MLKAKENIFKLIYLGCAIFGILAVLLIAIFLFAQGLPGMFEIGFFKFLFGSSWNPSANVFGILPMIVASIVVTALSTVIGAGTGVLSAVYLAHYCPKKLYKLFKNLINVLAGVPSVIFGFFGMELIVPFFNNISPTGMGNGLLSTVIILSIMILPTVIFVTLNSINNVPKIYYEGAVGLGATKNQAIFKVVLPACKNGIFSATILGIGRAIGETMAVTMVAGNVPNFPTSFFESIRTLTSNIVMELSYATDLHLDALIATGVVLFVFILLITMSLNMVTGKRKDKNRIGIFRKLSNKFSKNLEKNLTRGSSFLAGLSYTSISITLISLISIVMFVLIKGVPHLSLDFIFNKYTDSENITLMPAIVSTLMVIGISILLSGIIGIGTAIYLSEYTKKGSKLVKVVRGAVETLAGIPSIIYGLFGNLFFVVALGMGYSILAGGLTMTLMILPTMIRTTEQALLEVPDTYREASYALGTGKTRTIFKVVLPNAVSGIITGVILSIGRVISESAALIFTVGTIRTMPNGIMSGGITLSVFMYILANEGLYVEEAYATAVVLLVVVLAINTLASIVESSFKGKNNKQEKIKKRRKANG